MDLSIQKAEQTNYWGHKPLYFSYWSKHQINCEGCISKGIQHKN